jgi:RNA polymerase sigma-70 factor, ECF subfamily
VQLAFQAVPAIDAPSRFVLLRKLYCWIRAVPLDSEGTWADLMVAAQAGDARAYAQLLQQASAFIRAIARRYHSDAATAEDVVQETLIAIHRVRHTYEPGRPVEPWIAAIAKARAIDALRARKRRTAAETGAAQLAILETRAETKFEATAEVAAALEALPAAQRAAIRLLKIEELSLNEAAAASGRSVPALKSLLHRAMTALRGSLKE